MKKDINKYARKLPKLLSKEFGKKAFYSEDEVKKALLKGKLNLDHILYAYHIYCERESESLKRLSESEYETMAENIAQAVFFADLSEFEKPDNTNPI